MGRSHRSIVEPITERFTTITGAVQDLTYLLNLNTIMNSRIFKRNAYGPNCTDYNYPP